MTTTNQRLIEIIEYDEVKPQDIANALYVSLSTVEHWKTPKTNVSHRVMPKAMLELLEIKVLLVDEILFPEINEKKSITTNNTKKHRQASRIVSRFEAAVMAGCFDHPND